MVNMASGVIIPVRNVELWISMLSIICGATLYATGASQLVEVESTYF